MLDPENAARAIISVGKRLFSLGFMSGGSGNLSVRTGDGILVTPCGLCKGNIAEKDLVLTTPEGQVLSGGEPTSELPMHLLIYKRRPDINAVIHIHGPNAVALTVSGNGFRNDILPEIAIKLGEVVVTKFGMPSTKESAEVLLPYLNDDLKAAIIPFHGIIAMASTVEEAALIAETVEYASQVQVLTLSMGNLKSFSGAKF